MFKEKYSGFQEDDIVRVKSNCSGSEAGKEYKLVATNEADGDELWCWNGERNCCHCPENWELVKSITVNSSNQTFMGNVKDFFRGLTATEDERLLKELGLENPIGTPTQEGLELSAEISYKANRAEIIKVAKQMKEEQDKKK